MCRFPRGVSRSVNIGWARSVFGHSYLVQFVMVRLNLLQWWVSPANVSSNFVQSQSQAVEVSRLLMRRLGELRDRYKIHVALVFQYGGPDGIESVLPWERDRADVSRCAEIESFPIVDIHDALHTVYQEGGTAGYNQLWNMSDADRAYGHMSPKGNELVASLVFRHCLRRTYQRPKRSRPGP